MGKSKQHNGKLTVTIPYFSFENGCSEKKTQVIDMFKTCEDEEIVSNKNKKRSLKIAKMLEETLSPSVIKDLNILLTSLYAIALEDGYNRF